MRVAADVEPPELQAAVAIVQCIREPWKVAASYKSQSKLHARHGVQSSVTLIH